MRSNGLQASSYSPVADLNPSVAEALLDELKERLIAAYCQPIDTPSMSAFDRPEFRVEVLVRMYVDAAATEQVLEMLSTKDPYLVRGNDDLTWAQIVAGYDVPSTTVVAPWPVYEDVDPTADESEATTTVLHFPETETKSETGHGRSAAARRQNQREESGEEDRFVPPPPPPLPRLAAADQLGWLGLVGGPAVLVAAAVFKLALPSWVTLIAALGFIAGFVSLVVRMGNGEERYDDPENGAQV